MVPFKIACVLFFVLALVSKYQSAATCTLEDLTDMSITTSEQQKAVLSPDVCEACSYHCDLGYSPVSVIALAVSMAAIVIYCCPITRTCFTFLWRRCHKQKNGNLED